MTNTKMINKMKNKTLKETTKKYKLKSFSNRQTINHTPLKESQHDKR